MRDHPPNDDPTDPASQRWYWRQADRHAKISRVPELAEQGLSQRAIARQTGHHRQTVKQWLNQPIPLLPENMPVELSDIAPLPGPRQKKAKKKLLKHRIHALKAEGLSYSAIAREVGVHRVTVKAWLEEEPSPISESEIVTSQKEVDFPPPPAPWTSWDEMRQVRESLREHRFLMLRRPENLDSEEREQLAELLNSPVGSELDTVRCSLVD